MITDVTPLSKQKDRWRWFLDSTPSPLPPAPHPAKTLPPPSAQVPTHLHCLTTLLTPGDSSCSQPQFPESSAEKYVACSRKNRVSTEVLSSTPCPVTTSHGNLGRSTQVSPLSFCFVKKIKQNKNLKGSVSIKSLLWLRAFRDKVRLRSFGWSNFLAVGHRNQFWLSSGQGILRTYGIKRNWETTETRADPERGPVLHWSHNKNLAGTRLLGGNTATIWSPVSLPRRNQVLGPSWVMEWLDPDDVSIRLYLTRERQFLWRN